MSRKDILVTGVAFVLSASTALAQRGALPIVPPGSGTGQPHATGGITHAPTESLGSGHGSAGKGGATHSIGGPAAGGHAGTVGRNLQGHSASGTGSSSYRGTTTRGRTSSTGTVLAGHSAAGHSSGAPVRFEPSRTPLSTPAAAPGGISPAEFAKILALIHALGASGSATPAAASGTSGTGQDRLPILKDLDQDGDGSPNSTARTKVPGIGGSGAAATGSGYRGTTLRSGTTSRGRTLGAATTPALPPTLSGVPTGLMIETLSDGMAKAAGLREGDIILKIDGMRTQTTEELRAALAAATDRVSIEYLDAASGKTATKTVGVADSKLGVSVAETPVAK